jgi:hypothetical protein
MLKKTKTTGHGSLDWHYSQSRNEEVLWGKGV